MILICSYVIMSLNSFDSMSLIMFVCLYVFDKR